MAQKLFQNLQPPVRGHLSKEDGRTVVTKIPEAKERSALKWQLGAHVHGLAKLANHRLPRERVAPSPIHVPLTKFYAHAGSHLLMIALWQVALVLALHGSEQRHDGLFNLLPRRVESGACRVQPVTHAGRVERTPDEEVLVRELRGWLVAQAAKHLHEVVLGDFVGLVHEAARELVRTNVVRQAHEGDF